MDSGETSRKKTNDDETDRPLKKAKYLWQVKGKYHLKDNQTSNNKTETENDNKIDMVVNNTNKTITTTTTTTTTATKKNVCNDRSCIEAIIANSDKYMEFSLIDSPPNRKNIDKSISDEIPITLVKPNPKTDDYYLRKWQARQIAKGFLDNTINRVLEHWMVAPFDATDFVENCDSGGQVEDEGILMAIQSHGLQSGYRPSLFHCNTRNMNWEAQANCTCSKTPTIHQENLNSLTPFHQRTEPDLSDFHLNYYEDKPPPSPEIPLEVTDETSTYDPLKMDDVDFLDAAVAVAIQKKGLTSLNCVDCG